ERFKNKRLAAAIRKHWKCMLKACKDAGDIPDGKMAEFVIVVLLGEPECQKPDTLSRIWKVAGEKFAKLAPPVNFKETFKEIDNAIGALRREPDTQEKSA